MTEVREALSVLPVEDDEDEYRITQDLLVRQDRVRFGLHRLFAARSIAPVIMLTGDSAYEIDLEATTLVSVLPSAGRESTRST